MNDNIIFGDFVSWWLNDNTIIYKK